MSDIKLKAVFLALLFLQSCAQVSFYSSNSTPTYAFTRPGHLEQISVVGVREYYLWGLVPEKHDIDLAEIMSSAGLMTSAGITIEDYQTWSDKAWALVTLGIYLPRHFRVKGWGQRQGEDS